MKYNFEIKNVMGHYILEVNGQFYGSYDNLKEALEDLEAIKEQKKEEIAYWTLWKMPS